jgi:hypothetical protein
MRNRVHGLILHKVGLFGFIGPNAIIADAQCGRQYFLLVILAGLPGLGKGRFLAVQLDAQMFA